MVRLIRRTVRPQRIPFGKERVLARLGWAGVIGYASGFFEPTVSHLPASPFLRNEGLLGQTPRNISLLSSLDVGEIPACWSLP
jgi:hypothetical protein